MAVKWTLAILAGVAAIVYYGLRSGIKQEMRVIGLDNIRDKYDYVIVGAGSAGAVVSSRLSEDPDKSVLLLEAGGDETSNEFVSKPGLFPAQWGSPVDWQYSTVPQQHACKGYQDNRCYWPRGKMLGGCSSMNGMVYARGSRLDYDYWEKSGAKGWSFKNVLPYFLKSEDMKDDVLLQSDYHRKGGPLRVGYSPELTPVLSIILQAAAALGYPVKDYNDPDGLGFSQTQTTIRDGVRGGVDVAFLREASQRDNLHILTGVRVTKVLIEDSKAQGVEFMRGEDKREVGAGREVVLSAGAIGSPHLLMLSGVGPADHLRDLKIPVKADLPVGNNLHDHMMWLQAFAIDKPLGSRASDLSSWMSSVRYSLFGTGPLSRTNLEAVGFFNLQNSSYAEPDLEHHFTALDILGLPEQDQEAFMQAFDMKQEHRTWSQQTRKEIYRNKCPGCMWGSSLVNLQPKSRGTLRLASANPLEAPLMDPRYLHKDEDVEMFLEGYKHIEKLSKTGPLKAIGSRSAHTSAIPGCENHSFMSDDYVRCWIRHLALTVFHPVGTCRMGSIVQPTTVVDSDLRVKGIGGLRVADASIMPRVVSANTNAPVIMIGEVVADKIRGINSVMDIQKDLQKKGLI